MELATVLYHLFPEALWILHGDTYDDLEWLDNVIPEPTLDDCLEAWAELEPILRRAALKKSRFLAFQERSDPIFFEWQRGEAEESEWLEEVASIRAEFPYSG